MMSNENFEIIWPEEFAIGTYSDVTVATVPVDEPLPNETQPSNSGAETALVIGGLLLFGAAFAYFNDRNAKDTAESKQRENSN